ncbi:MAG: 4-(cytidine 5'-diphospho)-2-C-methyl-D-erythritol kinase, partial [Halanaerobiaceae bacterium]|nr:4-(cytidine 5'-diphospho)-2-C-methyl-D-erythritol kinase [Halanaerobiaceae bacterium]
INVHASIKGLPQGPANIAYRAAEMIIQYSGLSTGVDIRIEKKIPVAGGLAGGSSDAAAVLKGINILFGLNIDDTVLLDMAAELGSDVPFCLRGGTVFASGRGEILRELPDLKRVDLVIVNPGIEISTAWVYQEYDRLCEKRELPVRELLALIEDKAEIKWNEGWANVLEDAVLPYYQDIARIKENLKKMGASFVLMTGSGPTVFAVAETQKAVERIKNNWPEKKDFVTTAWTVKKDFFELW